MNNNQYQALISIVIVTINKEELLRAALESLLLQDYKNIEIIVVDNGSEKNIQTSIKDDFPTVKHIRLETNHGFAGGNNYGIREASGDYIALLNNDAKADPYWISSMLKLAEKDKELGAIASIVIDGNNPSIIDSCGVGIALDGMSRQAMRGQPVPTLTKPIATLAISGCACMFRKEALEKAGLFDEAFFAYCEDTDLSLRLQRLGWRISVAPGAYVTHYYSATSGPFSMKKVFWVERNHFWVALKNFPLWLILCLPLTTAWRLFVQVSILMNGKSQINKFINNAGIIRTASTILKAHAHALYGAPTALRNRSPKNRHTTNISISKTIMRFKLSMKQILSTDNHQKDDNKE